MVVITTEDQCFTWGNGIYGQLGNNRFGECSPEQIITKHLDNSIRFIACCAGEHHSCLLDRNGKVYTCGSNTHGVLGH